MVCYVFNSCHRSFDSSLGTNLDNPCKQTSHSHRNLIAYPDSFVNSLAHETKFGLPFISAAI